MRLSALRLGQKFGEIDTSVRGITKYHLSPMEQRAMAGFFSTELPNYFWRIRRALPVMAPPFIMAYLVYDLTEKKHDQLQRKQPGEFDHET